MATLARLWCLFDKHRWTGCKCPVCGKTRDNGHNWLGTVCHLCGATWTPRFAPLQIDLPVLGAYAETELVPWARMEYRTADGVREQLAEALGIEMTSVAQIVQGLMVPVFSMHHEQVMRYTTGPTVEGTPDTEATAWLATGAACKSSPDVAALFLLYYAFRKMKRDAATSLFVALARELCERFPRFDGPIWESWDPHDVIRYILADGAPAKFAAGLMQRAVDRRTSG